MNIPSWAWIVFVALVISVVVWLRRSTAESFEEPCTVSKSRAFFEETELAPDSDDYATYVKPFLKKKEVKDEDNPCIKDPWCRAIVKYDSPNVIGTKPVYTIIKQNPSVLKKKEKCLLKSPDRIEKLYCAWLNDKREKIRTLEKPYTSRHQSVMYSAMNLVTDKHKQCA